MLKKTLFIAASIALTIAMSSLAHAQSIPMGNDIYGTVIYGEQVLIQSYTSMPITTFAVPNPIYVVDPPVSNNVVVGKVATAKVSKQQFPVVSSVVTPVSVAPQQAVVPYSNLPVMPVAVQQPVCLSGG